jgi:tetratricopeptide (TPR) repeat protein
MEYKLKPITIAGIAEATAKAERYRNLNEPEEAESICRDILAIDASNQAALRLLGLSITDQFLGVSSDGFREANEMFQKLSDPYDRLYHTGLLYERRAKAQLYAGQPPYTLLPLFERALECFHEAGAISPLGNDDAILRWNRCVRLLDGLKHRLEEYLIAFNVQGALPI